MAKAALATMGTSPPVITEFVEYMHRTGRLDHLTILSTGEKKVVDGALLAKIATQKRYPHMEVMIHILPLDDITNEEENYVFMEEAVKVIAALRRRYSELNICLAGGRKEMVASIMLIAQLTGINTVYHIVSPNIKEMNIELEKIRYEIEELAESDEPEEYYNANREKFEPIMYPPPTTYNVIKLPLIPYPERTIHQIGRILSGQRGRFDRNLLAQLRQAELVAVTREGWVIVTDEGRKVFNHVVKHLIQAPAANP